ncbi:DUF418 domain-containing protein [Bacillus taeanensis]|uniref:DUF418 domain-containing protein n=2 Tax=Bacillus taeanensis TaxID=273032 RepID=A0A366XXN6_9BACI|nr:DUF418 domain-containing protein [Bacillus taeanensis]
MRGFAILGIFFVNMLAFHSPFLYLNPQSWWKSSPDYYAYIFIDIFAQSSFYTLFSFLFGFGMIIFKERAVKRGFSFVRLFMKRLLSLLIFGVIHAFFIWHGDILITYALFGFILLLFHKAKSRTLLIWTSALLLIPSLLIGGMLFMASILSPTEWSTLVENQEMIKRSLHVYSSGTYLDITRQRFIDWTYVNGNENIVFIFLSLFPMFLLGAYTAKKKWLSHVELHKRAFMTGAFLSFIAGFAFKIIPLFSDNAGLLYLQDALGGPFVAIFYICMMALASLHKVLKPIMIPFSLVGRLSLSHYLFQSVIGTLLFYSYGLGLYGKTGAFTGTIMVVVIFSFQVIISKMWLKRYRFGPIEWIWKIATYGKKTELLKKGVD